MNAAGRLVHQGLLYRHLVLTHFLTRRQVAVVVLSVAILFSLLATIYVTHLSRVLNAAVQKNTLAEDRLNVERGQLLLERSTWMMQSRIQKLAENKLGMIIPNHKSVVIIHE